MRTTNDPTAPQPPEDPYTLTLSERIQHATRRAGIAAGVIAKTLGVHKNTVSSWMNGRTTPRARELAQIAELTGYPLEWLESGAPAQSTITVPSKEAVIAIRNLVDLAKHDLVRIEGEWGMGGTYENLLAARDVDAVTIEAVEVVVAEWERAYAQKEPKA